MPYPKPNEKQDEYIQRCMSNPEMNNKHPDNKERYAVCQSFWENKSSQSSDEGLKEFVKDILRK